MMLQRQNGITAMGLALMLAFGTTLADMKSQLVKQIPIRWKEITLNYVITWHAWLANHVASHVAPTLSSVLSSYLSIVSTADNSTNNSTPTTQRTS